MPKQVKQHYKLAFADDLYDLQQEILDTMDSRKYRFHVAILGRQSGKSYLDKRICLEYSNNRKMRGMWISPAISSANTHWADLLRMIEDSGLPTKRINRSTKEIEFHGGGYIGIRSAIEPDNIRGDSLDYVILDEAAFYRNGKYVWESVILPMITTTRGIMLMTTTPNGLNWVHELYEQGMSGKSKLVKSWHMPSTESPIQDHELLEEIRKSMTEKAWRAEFMAEFLADGGGVFAGVQEAATLMPLKAPLPGHTYVCGIDFGGNDDSTCITIIDKFTREQVFGISFDNIGTIKTVKKLIEILDYWQPEVTFAERNGVGTHLGKLIKEILSGNLDDQAIDRLLTDTDEDAEEWIDELGESRHKFRLIWMDNVLKRECVERIAVDLEYGRLDILSDKSKYGKKQLSEMSTYEATRTRSQLAVTYAAQEGAHDDTISALYLAYMGIPKPKPFKKKWQKVKSSKNPFRSSSAPRKHRTGNRRLR